MTWSLGPRSTWSWDSRVLRGLGDGLGALGLLQTHVTETPRVDLWAQDVLDEDGRLAGGRPPAGRGRVSPVGRGRWRGRRVRTLDGGPSTSTLVEWNEVRVLTALRVVLLEAPETTHLSPVGLTASERPLRLIVSTIKMSPTRTNL